MEPSKPSIADLLEATNRELAGTDARVYRRVGEHLQRTYGAIQELKTPEAASATSTVALLGKGNFLQQSVITLKGLCRQHGIKGYSKLKKPALAAVLEQHGVEPPPRPLESFSKQELIGLVRGLLGYSN